MGIEFFILFAHLFSQDVYASLEREPIKQVQIQQQIYIETADKNTRQILEAIEKIK